MVLTPEERIYIEKEKQEKRVFEKHLKKLYQKGNMTSDATSYTKWKKEHVTDDGFARWQMDRLQEKKSKNDIRSKMMNKQYVRKHPELLVKPNLEPREHPDPRSWRDRNGVEHFGNKRYTVVYY